jgi:hypothetical protein
MKRPLTPAPRVMNAGERAAERRFLWKLLAATIGLHLVGGAIAMTAVCRGVRPAPRPGGVVQAPASNVQAPFDPKAPLR